MNEAVPTGKTTTEAKADLQGILRKVRGLLDKANGTDNEHERAIFQAKAEELMRKYRIAEEHLIAADPISVEPIRIRIDLCDLGSEKFSQGYLGLMQQSAKHAGIRARYSWVAPKEPASSPEGAWILVAEAIGYEGDLRLAELLFTQARMVFQEKVEPKVDPTLSDKENCYRLRSAGIERNRVANLLWGASMDSDGAWGHRKVGNLYKEACAERGEDPSLNGRQINAKTFREAYAREFVERFGRRLRESRMAADSTGGALQIHGRQERVDEAFYEAFPEYRPSTEVVERKPCEGCKKAKGGKCRQHNFRWTKADQARHDRQYYSTSALAGREAGVTAADEVSIDRVAPAQRLEEDRTRKTTRNITGLEIEG